MYVHIIYYQTLREVDKNKNIVIVIVIVIVCASVVRFYHCPGASASIWTLVQSKLLVQYNGLR